ncbi:MAG TPA: hypothetical protein PK045_03015 [Candidatus Woesebacteria bacterium]|nr:hypothetical protein [Candidatus Woesebacteria bacterium]HPJ17323.1 hypothetical protein [Candidatus Woesebacteria bacterium]
MADNQTLETLRKIAEEVTLEGGNIKPIYNIQTGRWTTLINGQPIETQDPDEVAELTGSHLLTKLNTTRPKRRQ